MPPGATRRSRCRAAKGLACIEVISSILGRPRRSPNRRSRALANARCPSQAPRCRYRWSRWQPNPISTSSTRRSARPCCMACRKRAAAARAAPADRRRCRLRQDRHARPSRRPSGAQGCRPGRHAAADLHPARGRGDGAPRRADLRQALGSEAPSPAGWNGPEPSTASAPASCATTPTRSASIPASPSSTAATPPTCWTSCATS